MPHYIYLIRPVTPGFSENMSDQDAVTMGEHFQRLQQALTAGKLVLAGPCLDESFGVVIFEADTIEEAEVYMLDDPAVKHGLMTGEIHEFRVSLLKGQGNPAVLG